MPAAQTVEHETPRDLFDALDREFGPFNLDPAARDGQYTAETIWERGGEYMIAPPLDDEGNSHGISGVAYHPSATDKRERVYFDGLKMSWRVGAQNEDEEPGVVFMNPPYGRGVERWVEKAVREVESENARRVVALLKATTDVKWWHQYVITEAAYDGMAGHDLVTLVRFLPGRLRFGGADGPAPFPSAVVVWSRDE